MAIFYLQLLKENFLKYTSNLHCSHQDNLYCSHQDSPIYFLSLKNLLKLFQQIFKPFYINFLYYLSRLSYGP